MIKSRQKQILHKELLRIYPGNYLLAELYHIINTFSSYTAADTYLIPICFVFVYLGCIVLVFTAV